jgi:hypothetical protein
MIWLPQPMVSRWRAGQAAPAPLVCLVTGSYSRLLVVFRGWMRLEPSHRHSPVLRSSRIASVAVMVEVAGWASNRLPLPLEA